VVKEASVCYLGFYQSPDGSWKDMVARVMEESRKPCNKLEKHLLSVDEETDLTQAIVVSAFRRPAALVPWAMQELNRLEQLWQTAFKALCHLMGGTCADVLMFPSHSGGMQCPRPLSILWEATARHIERAVRHDDVARQIIVQELKAALDLWMCSIWQKQT
jgi:hypothetical protein